MTIVASDHGYKMLALQPPGCVDEVAAAHQAARFLKLNQMIEEGRYVLIEMINHIGLDDGDPRAVLRSKIDELEPALNVARGKLGHSEWKAHAWFRHIDHPFVRSRAGGHLTVIPRSSRFCEARPGVGCYRTFQRQPNRNLGKPYPHSSPRTLALNGPLDWQVLAKRKKSMAVDHSQHGRSGGICAPV